MTIVDSHLHVNFNGLSIKGILRYLDKNSIDSCWLLTWEETNLGSWDYRPVSVEDTYEAYLAYPNRFIPFYAPDPHKDNCVALLENWYKKGIRGCGELKATLDWNSEQVKLILNSAKKLKMPIVFHMEESENRDIPYSEAIYDRVIYYGMRTKRSIYSIPQRILGVMVNHFTPLRDRTRGASYFFPGYMLDFASLEVALRDYPDINFIAHGPMFWKYISADGATCRETLPKGSINGEGIIWRLLSDYPNLYADTSANSGLNALTRDPTTTKRFLSMFKDKILFGTDNTYDSMNQQKDYLNGLALPEGIYSKIYGGNADRILNG